MAISDTLSQASHEIRGYLENQPSVYAAVRGDMDKLLAEMDRLRTLLDHPKYDPTGPYASVREATWHAVGKSVANE